MVGRSREPQPANCANAHRSWSTAMKPLGLYTTISSRDGEPAALDDDYDWYVRRVASERAAAAATRRPRAAFATERLGAIRRLLRSRHEAPAARRI
jgi:hypothetical protein